MEEDDVKAYFAKFGKVCWRFSCFCVGTSMSESKTNENDRLFFIGDRSSVAQRPAARRSEKELCLCGVWGPERRGRTGQEPETSHWIAFGTCQFCFQPEKWPKSNSAFPLGSCVHRDISKTFWLKIRRGIFFPHKTKREIPLFGLESIILSFALKIFNISTFIFWIYSSTFHKLFYFTLKTPCIYRLIDWLNYY